MHYQGSVKIFFDNLVKYLGLKHKPKHFQDSFWEKKFLNGVSVLLGHGEVI